MALVFRALYQFYFDYVEGKKDPRIDHYPLLGSPIKIITVLGLYLYFVSSYGRKFMENRQPFELNKIMTIYNAIQVIINGIYSMVAIHAIFFYYDYSKEWRNYCAPPDYSYTEKGYFEARMTYIYFLFKILDLLDTIFFVLRKRYKQITFLHVYHHLGICFGVWIGVRYCPGGHTGILGLINCIVHTIMYFYYFLTAFKPELKKSLWWKKYITIIQMTQFSFLILHFSIPIIRGNCGYPFFWLMVLVIQNTFMLILFSDFYIRALEI
ncbi:elongation of very long chain fatty acids protein 7-like [Condylostylus longicornis]|uniref:elongation of very long chain fatty acids protein 7-like n=1 Tax=Condylostylus longicornis TaxID=2530218 RepID=UPI00244E01F4|nr:elongation of very long chain fatty acids protein 7-like [Condylostylus longicornis]